MRICIVGGGLAGSLLAWRLAGAAGDRQIDLVLGERRRADATAASGGAVRAYERHPEQRRLACLSMVELLASPTLRDWADYQPTGSVYLRRDADGVEPELAELHRALPGSARLAAAGELADLGWAGVHRPATAVVERSAGHTSPDRLREAVLSDGAVRRRVRVQTGAVRAVGPAGAGLVAATVAGQRREYDMVVLAAGAWTGALLRGNGLPAAGYRTKSIQYAVHPAGDWRPPQFVDECTGLYGRPTADGGLLLGLPTERWDVDPDEPPLGPVAPDAAARLAETRFPKLRIGPATRRAGAADCYADEPILSLRPVTDEGQQLFTFAGGAGGSVKTALAASHRAAIQLAESHPSTVFASVGRKGQR